MPRTIAIGDIHGCAKAFEALLAEIAPRPDDTIVTLGDYIDRGPDSRQVVQRMIELVQECHLVPLLGNHDEMLLQARDSRETMRFWLECGGLATLKSYNALEHIERIPSSHINFLEQCQKYFESNTHFFIHANYEPDISIVQQPDHSLRWLSLRDVVPGPHMSGKVAVLGHTPQKKVLNLGHLIAIDTGCCYGGCLTAIDVESGQIWQTCQD